MIGPLRFALGSLAAFAASHGAVAQPRPATPAMACAAAADLVTRSGAIVLTTGPFTYARFVRDAGFCSIAETTKPAFELTLDNPKCFVGYLCRDKFNEGNNRD
ncbi:MAG: hypothetical protein K2Y56_14220 [Methylobacterium sp.]|uniref:hypothetical protein n=1 Tax=Methylobacterium sp. TaxID=409 RepID=UPI0025E52236|nr:hypothetical protein [Methylobacterium sp.]MBX9932675.1 hypothetical protein [Methylobacterium sp.]